MQSAAHRHVSIERTERVRSRLSLSDIASKLQVPVVVACYRSPGNILNHSTFGLDFGVNWAEFAAAIDLVCADRATIIPNVEGHPELGKWTASLAAKNIRFFAGTPLLDYDGWRIGSIAVVASQQHVACNGIAMRELRELGREFSGVAPKMEAAGAGRLMR